MKKDQKNIIDRCAEYFVVGLFCAMLAVGALQILNRHIAFISISWSEELQRYLHVWLVFTAIPIAYRNGAHIGVTIIQTIMPKWMLRSISLFSHLLWLLLSVALMTQTVQLMLVAQHQITPALQIGMHYIYFGIVLGGAYLAYCAVRFLRSGAYSAPTDEKGSVE